MNNLKTFSAKQTKNLARLLYKELFEKRLKTKDALVIALTGELGSGKTTFVQGFLRAAGARKRITSPTFVIIKSYKVKSCKAIYHIDCYRIKKPKELLDLGLERILSDRRNVVLIEWAEKIQRILPKNAVWINFKYGKRENERVIEFS
jgi:tRNA threonylcarbamoyladenosine biosynthesis protein TsaE